MVSLNWEKSRSHRAKKPLADQKPVTKQTGERKHFSPHQIALLGCLSAAILSVVLVTHWPCLSARALSFDDQHYLTDNPLVQNPSWGSAKRFLTELLEPSTVPGYYQPLAMISLMLDYAVAGDVQNLRPFHRTSLTLHVMNTLLVIVLLYLLFGHVWAAAAAGLLFGVHPMTVESITWVADRKTLLAMFFTLWSLILYVGYVRRANRKLYVVCILMYLFALLSKPTSTPLPVLLLLLDYWPLRRLKWGAVLEKLPFFVMGGISAIITYVSQSRTAIRMPSEFPVLQIPLMLCHNIIFYLCKIIWPTNLTSHYPFPEPMTLSQRMVLAGVVGTFVLIPVLLISLRWTCALLVGWLFFFVAIFPTMQLLRFADTIAADRFAYLPSVGILLVVTWFFKGVWNRGITGRVRLGQAAVVLTVVILAIFEVIGTRRYLPYWQETEKLYRYMVRTTPKAVPPRFALGEFLLTAQGQVDEAIEELREALRLSPKYGLQAQAHNNLAYALVAKGRVDDAIVHYTTALHFNPDFADAHANFAYALAHKGNLREAIQHCNEALRIKPDSPKVMNNLAWLIATSQETKLRDPEKAVRLAKQACEFTNYKKAGLMDTLAAAYAAAGKFHEAVVTAEKALKLAQTSRQDQLIIEIRSRLSLYKAGKPYIESKPTVTFD